MAVFQWCGVSRRNGIVLEIQRRCARGAFGGELAFDFSGGGNYVAAILTVKGATDIKGVRLWLKNPSGNGITFRYTDSTGQTLQKTTTLPPSGEWAEIEFECWQWSGHWGGANDGIVHGPPSQIAFCVENSGRRKGSLLIDDVRLVEGKPVVPVWSCVVARFEPAEGWFSRGDAQSQLLGKSWHFDFSKGQWAGIGMPDRSLPGTPKQIRLRFKGDASGHGGRLSVATHFMGFERNIGEARPVPGEKGVFEFATPAPPGIGWRWFGGENDGKLHGPLRITGFAIDCNNKRNGGDLELLDLRIETECSPRRLVTLVADLREQEGKGQFALMLRSLSDRPLAGDVNYTIRNWAGKTIEGGTRKVTLPAGAEPVEAVVPLPPGEHRFLEAEFSFAAPRSGCRAGPGVLCGAASNRPRMPRSRILRRPSAWAYTCTATGTGRQAWRDGTRGQDGFRGGSEVVARGFRLGAHRTDQGKIRLDLLRQDRVGRQTQRNHHLWRTRLLDRMDEAVHAGRDRGLLPLRHRGRPSTTATTSTIGKSGTSRISSSGKGRTKCTRNCSKGLRCRQEGQSERPGAGLFDGGD